jgi:uncharacterized protein DUF5916
VLAAVAAFGLAASAATTAAIRVSTPPTEETWRQAPAIDAFVQREPHEGGAPSQRTEFRVAYDATTLYVNVRAWDREPERIVTYLTRRDETSPGDWIHLLIDSYHDRRTAYEFMVNPSGVKRDRYWFNDTSSDDSWDAVWDVSVSRDSQGWSAEFRIPFSQLRFNRAEANVFGFAVAREIGRLNETSTWPLLARSAIGYVSSFGELAGLAMSSAPRRLELLPYTVADTTRQHTLGNPLIQCAASGASFGLDAKYALTPGLTLTATVNPDFGQVEADPAVVNLTAFETFFAERRPFFVEGSGTFNFGIDCNDGTCTGLFYSRRIGRTPQGNDDLPSGDRVFTDAPSQTPILGAAKITGRAGPYSIGVLQAFTQRETARIFDGGVVTRRPVEPATSYSVARVRREFANQSSIGLMATSTNRAIGDDLRFLPDTATTVGVDWDARFRKWYALTGYVVGSTVRGDPGAIERLQEDSRHYFQRPDLKSASLDPTRAALDGSAGQVGFGKIGGEFVRFNSWLSFKTPGFDINDVGYLRRADQRSTSNWLQVRSDRPNRWFRSRNINVNQWASWNFDGDRLDSGQNINGSILFTNNWRVGAGRNWNQLTFDDRATRGGPAVRANGFDVLWHFVTTDNRRLAFVNYFGIVGSDGVGSRFTELDPEVTIRPVPALMLTAGARINRNTNDWQWVDAVTDARTHYVFAHMDQTTVALTGRLNFTLAPTLSLQLYGQPFVSAGDFRSYKETLDPRSTDYGRRFTPFAYDIAANTDPNFNVKSFRTTNVLRWEYRPGSTLFVVWQQARENDAVPGGFRLGRDVHDIFGVAPKNVFLVKLAYWLNY